MVIQPFSTLARAMYSGWGRSRLCAIARCAMLIRMHPFSHSEVWGGRAETDTSELPFRIQPSDHLHTPKHCLKEMVPLCEAVHQWSHPMPYIDFADLKSR